MRSRRAFAKLVVLVLGIGPLLAYVGRSRADSPKPQVSWDGIQRTCTITCPACNATSSELMSRESLKRVYHCPQCLAWLAPKSGDHCIYDSYGSVMCPPLQLKAKGRRTD